MSRIPTHLPAPSYHGFMFRYPSTDLLHQYRPVYYSSGIRPAHFRSLQASHRARIAEAKQALETERAGAINFSQSCSNSSISSSSKTEAAVRLASAGLPTEASAVFLSQHQAGKGKLAPVDYCRYISALGAPRVFDHLMHGEANFDKAVAFKMMGDFGGNSRAQEALSAFEMAAEALSISSKDSSSNNVSGGGGSFNKIMFYNSLMQALLSCGFENVRRVSGDVYDSIGAAKLNPIPATYKAVMLSLCLQANPDEAANILSFLRSSRPTSSPSPSSSSSTSSSILDIGMFNNLMLGYREARIFDKVDEIWSELVDRRVPMPNVETSEEMIRSVVELANTPLTDPALQFKAQLNVVERKRIPIILSQMEQMGIMRCNLSPPVLHEVESGLRQFSIWRNRFYEWGRAVKLFDFVEYRRKHGWLHDMQDINIPTTHAPTLRPYGADPLLGIAPFATESLPAHLMERNSWERPPLEHIFNKISVDEKLEDSRAGGDKYFVNSTPLHARDAAWRNKVPQTRYDAVYGMSSPSMPAIGVRRHLAGTESAALGTNEHQARSDGSIVRRSLAKARRARMHMERARTHRAAASLE